MNLIFSYPSRILLPNKKASWQAKMVATRQARSDAYYAGLAQGGRKEEPLTSVFLFITWYPPSKRRVADADSQFAATKPIIDGGLVDAGFILNDKPVIAGGAIKEITVRYGEIATHNPRTEILICKEIKDSYSLRAMSYELMLFLTGSCASWNDQESGTAPSCPDCLYSAVCLKEFDKSVER